MNLNSMEKQPIGAFYVPLIKYAAISFLIALFMGIATQQLYSFTSFIIVLFGIGIFYAIYKKLQYDNYRYSVSDDKITVEMGILSKDTIATLFHLVKDVNINEPILLRMLGLAKIRFESPTDYLEIILTKEDAVALQNLMTSKMAVNRLAMVDQKA